MADIIPEDWNIIRMGDICHFENGDRGVNYPSKSDFISIGFPFVNAGHLGNNRVQLGAMDYISEQHFNILNAGKFKTDDILFCLRGSLGKFAVVGTEIESGAIASSLIIIRNIPTIIYHGFLVSYLQSPQCKKMIEKWAGGAAQPNLGGRDLARFSISLPPTLEEQEAIAGALSDMDALISSLETLITKKRHIKQGALQGLLKPKEGWVEKTLGSLLTIRHGKSQHAVVDDNGEYPILATGGQIGNANTFLYNKPSVLIGRKGTIDRPQYMDQPFWTVDTLFFSEIHKPNNAKYLFYQFCLIDWRRHNEASGVPSLNATTIENIEIKIPDPSKQPDEQARIATILSDMDAEITVLEKKLTKTRQLKQGMMAELLTGRIRLV